MLMEGQLLSVRRILLEDRNLCSPFGMPNTARRQRESPLDCAARGNVVD
jgi:hypothetical protein